MQLHGAAHALLPCPDTAVPHGASGAPDRVGGGFSSGWASAVSNGLRRAISESQAMHLCMPAMPGLLWIDAQSVCNILGIRQQPWKSA